MSSPLDWRRLLSVVKQRVSEAFKIFQSEHCSTQCIHSSCINEPSGSLSVSMQDNSGIWVCASCGAAFPSLPKICSFCTSGSFQCTQHCLTQDMTTDQVHCIHKLFFLSTSALLWVPSAAWCYAIRRILSWVSALLPYSHRLQRGAVASPPFLVNNTCIIWLVDSPHLARWWGSFSFPNICLHNAW